MNEADEATSTQTGIEVGVTSIPAPPGVGKAGAVSVSRSDDVGFVICVMCPVYLKQQTLPDPCQHFAVGPRAEVS